MLRNLLTVILLFGAFGPVPMMGAVSPEHGEALWKKIGNNPNYPWVDMQGLTEEERVFVLRRALIDKQRGAMNDIFLAHLGEEEAIKKLVKNWNEGSINPGVDLESAARPEVIPMIAQTLFLDEKYDKGEGDLKVSPHSFCTAGLILNILRKSIVFDPDIARWCNQLTFDNEEETVEFREIMREWWRANEQAFLKKDYRAVKPGRKLADKSVELLPKTGAEPEPATSAATMIANNQPALESESQAPGRSYAGAIGTAVIALIGGAWWWQQRKSLR